MILLAFSVVLPPPHVETRRITTRQERDVAHRTTTTHFIDVPFPTHPKCYKKKKRAVWWGAVIFISPILLAIIAILGMMAVNLVRYGTWQAPATMPVSSSQDTDYVIIDGEKVKVHPGGYVIIEGEKINIAPERASTSSQDTNGSGSSWPGCMISVAAIVGGPAYSFWVTKKLNKQILDYYYTHVQR